MPSWREVFRTSFGSRAPSRHTTRASPQTARTPSPDPSTGSTASVIACTPVTSTCAFTSSLSPKAVCGETQSSRPSPRTRSTTAPFAPDLSTPHEASNESASPPSGISTANAAGIRIPKKCLCADVENRFSSAVQATSTAPFPRTTFETSNCSQGICCPANAVPAATSAHANNLFMPVTPRLSGRSHSARSPLSESRASAHRPPTRDFRNTRRARP